MKLFDNQHLILVLCLLVNFNLCIFYLEQLCYQISFSLQVVFFIRMGLIVIIGYSYFLSFFFFVFDLNDFKSFRRWFQNSPNTTNFFRLFRGDSTTKTHQIFYMTFTFGMSLNSYINHSPWLVFLLMSQEAFLNAFHHRSHLFPCSRSRILKR